MSATDDAKRVSNNIKEIYNRRLIALYALSLDFAARAIREFRTRQSGGEFWENRTRQALDRMFADGFYDFEQSIIGWFMAHGVEYGPYLELANDRRHAAIVPIVEQFADAFFKAAKEIIG